MKSPKKYFEFALVKLNRIFRSLGFVLVISFRDDEEDSKEDTMIFFCAKRPYDEWCEQFRKKK